jgi:hypothetical protein
MAPSLAPLHRHDTPMEFADTGVVQHHGNRLAKRKRPVAQQSGSRSEGHVTGGIGTTWSLWGRGKRAMRHDKAVLDTSLDETAPLLAGHRGLSG